MGSQDSNVDSDGIPMDHDEIQLEFGLFNGPPFALSSSVFQEVCGHPPILRGLLILKQIQLAMMVFWEV